MNKKKFMSLPLKIGDVLLTYNHKSWISKIIWFVSRKKKTDAKISHAVLCIGKGLICDILPQGVVIINQKYYDLKYFDIYVLRPKNKVNVKKLLKKVYNDTGLIGYRWCQLLLIICKRYLSYAPCFLRKKNKKKQICSEFIIDALMEADAGIMIGKDNELISPLDIFKCGELNLIYKTQGSS